MCIVYVGQQFVMGDVGVVDQDVGFVIVVVVQVFVDFVDGIVGGDVELQCGVVYFVGGFGQVFGGGFYIDGDYVGVVVSEYFGDGCVDVVGCIGYNGDFVVQWFFLVGWWCGIVCFDREDLVVDVG